MNATEQVARVRRAGEVVAQWGEGTRVKVAGAAPAAVQERGVSLMDWWVTVALFRLDHETPIMAAERLARYITLHAERWDETPTLASLDQPHRSVNW